MVGVAGEVDNSSANVTFVGLWSGLKVDVSGEDLVDTGEKMLGTTDDTELAGERISLLAPLVPGVDGSRSGLPACDGVL
jgi:hypothetical protein